jgi:hypothetical protein
MTNRFFVGTLARSGTTIVLLGAMSQHQARAQIVENNAEVGVVSPCGIAEGDTAK